MSADDSGDSAKQLAVEVCITLSESAPAMVRKTSEKYIPTLSKTVVFSFFLVFKIFAFAVDS